MNLLLDLLLGRLVLSNEPFDLGHLPLDVLSLPCQLFPPFWLRLLGQLIFQVFLEQLVQFARESALLLKPALNAFLHFLDH